MTYEKDDIPKEFKELFHYIKDSKTVNVPKDSELIKIVDNRVQYLRNSEDIKEEYAMLNLYENELYTEALTKGKLEGKNEGILIGEAKGKLVELISLVKDGILNSSVAAKRLNISEESFLAKMKEAELLS